MVLRVWDDNLHVVATSLAVMGTLAAALRVVDGTPVQVDPIIRTAVRLK